MGWLVSVFLLLLIAPQAAWSNGGLNHVGLEKELEKISKSNDGRVGICVKDEYELLICVRGTDRFSMQSVMKLIVGVAVFDAADSGRLDLNGSITIRREDLSLYVQPLAKIVRQNGHFETTVYDLVRRAIVDSDSAATDILIRRLGGVKSIAAFLTRKGIDGLRVDRDERHLQTDIIGIKWQEDFVDPLVLQRAIDSTSQEKRDVAFYSYQNDLRDTATPQAMTLFLAALVDGKLLSPSSSQKILDLMEKNTTFPDRLRAGIGEGWSLSNKTGTSLTWRGITAATNDVGVLTTKDGKKIAISVFVADSHSNSEERARVISDTAKAVVAAYGQ